MPMTARRSFHSLLALTVISAVSLTAAAQSSLQPDNSQQSQGAPIERSVPQQPTQAMRPHVQRSQLAEGIWLSVSPRGTVATVASTPERTELRIESGVANLMVHRPAHDHLILVDLGGGQVDVLKDGLYTFNAQTRTMRTLVGEAEAFVGTDGSKGGKAVKVKQDHSLTFGSAVLKSVEFQPFQAREDLLPRENGYARSDAGMPAGYGFYGDGPYGGYPYFAYGYGYPYGFYPGFGFGFGYGGFGGYYGGFGRGGFGGRGGRR